MPNKRLASALGAFHDIIAKVCDITPSLGSSSVEKFFEDTQLHGNTLSHRTEAPSTLKVDGSDAFDRK